MIPAQITAPQENHLLLLLATPQNGQTESLFICAFDRATNKCKRWTTFENQKSIVPFGYQFLRFWNVTLVVVRFIKKSENIVHVICEVEQQLVANQTIHPKYIRICFELVMQGSCKWWLWIVLLRVKRAYVAFQKRKSQKGVSGSDFWNWLGKAGKQPRRGRHTPHKSGKFSATIQTQQWLEISDLRTLCNLPVAFCWQPHQNRKYQKSGISKFPSLADRSLVQLVYVLCLSILHARFRCNFRFNF